MVILMVVYWCRGWNRFWQFFGGETLICVNFIRYSVPKRRVLLLALSVVRDSFYCAPNLFRTKRHRSKSRVRIKHLKEKMLHVKPQRIANQNDTLKNFTSTRRQSQNVTEAKNRNFTKNVAGKTVVCKNFSGITVISNIVCLLFVEW